MQPEASPKNSLSVPLAIIAAGAMIAVAIYFGGSSAPVANGGQAQQASVVEAISEKDHILGNKNAKIIVIEYSDLECPFCKVFHNTMHQIVDSYQGQVAWVYRHFPIADLHPKAPLEAEASECAAEQGGNDVFWKYIDAIFARTNSNDSLDPKELENIAKELGLDIAKFNQCLDNGTYTKLIESSVAKAIQAGARGTPYSVILRDGKQVEGSGGIINGAEPFERIKAKLDAVLK